MLKALYSRVCCHSAGLAAAAVSLTVFYWQLDNLPERLLLGAIQGVILWIGFLIQRSSHQYEACIELGDWTRTARGQFEYHIKARQHRRGNLPSVAVYRLEHPGRLRDAGCLEELDASGNITLFSKEPLQGVVVVKH